MTSERSTLTLRFLAAPTDAGQSGVVGAGRVLEWIDKAGYGVAARWGRGRSVTAYVGNVRFSAPIEVGHLVEVRSRIIKTGRSSMNILVEVSSGFPGGDELASSTQCLLVFVAVDENGKSRPVPSLEPRDEAGRQLEAWAERRAQVRAEVQEAMKWQSYSTEGTAPRVTLRFLARPTDVNWGGKVHGGFVMAWIDEAAHVLATQWTGDPSNVAIFTGGVRFYRPMYIGHLIEVEARLLHTGRTSMHIGVHVRSADPAGGELGEMETTTYCRTIFVGIDADRKAVPTPSWTPVSEEDKRLDAHALELVAIREKYENPRTEG